MMVELHTGPINQVASAINEAIRSLKTNAYPIALAIAFIYLFRAPGT